MKASTVKIVRHCSPTLYVVYLLLALCISGTHLVQRADAVWFHLSENVKRCFIEEVPNDVLVVAQYSILDWDRLQSNLKSQTNVHLREQVSASVTVNDAAGQQLVVQDLIKNGRLAFTSQQGGEHTICFLIQTPINRQKKYRIQLSMDVGDHAVDYSDLAKHEHLSAIEVEVRRLNDRLKDIRNEQDFQRMREEQFRDKSEEFNSRIVWWSLIQIVLTQLAAGFQFLVLRNFFIKKKLS